MLLAAVVVMRSFSVGLQKLTVFVFMSKFHENFKKIIVFGQNDGILVFLKSAKLKLELLR